jgi:hypothetical protein
MNAMEGAEKFAREVRNYCAFIESDAYWGDHAVDALRALHRASRERELGCVRRREPTMLMT